MSGDWLKMEVGLPEKPEVWQIAGIVGIDADSVVGKLLKVWRWFDAHTEDGNAAGVTYPLVDHVAGVTGFAEAMALCGWLIQNGSVMSVPHFDRHNGKTAKNRALTAKRVAKCKDKGNAVGNGESVTAALPREEKRREKVNTPVVPKGDSDAVVSAYNDLLPLCERVSVLNPKRQKRIAAVVKLARKVCADQGWPYEALNFWRAYFSECAKDPWMRGEVANPNNARWKQNLDVLIHEDRFAKVMDRAIESLRRAS
jgi:hypothetical protein